jgi:hypothetical protein
MVPPSTRLSIAKAFSQASSWAKWSGKAAGNAVWVVTTTALLVGLPMAIAIEDETRLVAQEKEMMGQQQGQAGVRPLFCAPLSQVALPGGDALETSAQIMTSCGDVSADPFTLPRADAPPSVRPDAARPARLLMPYRHVLFTPPPSALLRSDNRCIAMIRNHSLAPTQVFGPAEPSRKSFAYRRKRGL